MNDIQELIKQAGRGIKDAEGKMYALLYERFLGLAKQRIWNTKKSGEEIIKDAQDIAQDAIKILLQKRRKFYGSKYPIQYAMLVLRNIIGNYYRSPDRINVNLDDIDLAVEADEYEIVDIQSIIRDMSNEFCQQILIYMLSDYSRQWISKKLDISMNALYTRIHRCLARLKDLVKQKGIER